MRLRNYRWTRPGPVKWAPPSLVNPSATVCSGTAPRGVLLLLEPATVNRRAEPSAGRLTVRSQAAPMYVDQRAVVSPLR
jgi:hypothetical protein